MDGSADEFFKAGQIAFAEAWNSQNDAECDIAIDMMIAVLPEITDKNYDYAKRLVGAVDVEEFPERADAIVKALEENENLKTYLTRQFLDNTGEATALGRSGEFEGNLENRYNMRRLNRIGQHLHMAN